MTGISSLGWFILGALWVIGIVVAWTVMKMGNRKQPDRMSAEWLEKRRREERGER